MSDYSLLFWPSTPPADLWRRSTTCGYSGVTLRSSTTTRWRRRRRRMGCQDSTVDTES